MKVLFVSSGNIKKFGISPIIINQGESLRKEGVNIIYYGIKGKGFYNYLINIFKLKKFIKNEKVDLIHAHYSYTAIIATLANFKIPMVVSFMGSDADHKGVLKIVLKFFNRFFWDALIVKSQNMKDRLSFNNVNVIPNGVDLELFRPINKLNARNHLSFDIERKYIIFIADPSRAEKNYKLAYDSVEILKKEINVELNIVFGESGIDHNEIFYYINAADALVLTSLNEGSPNVVKEAMACNCPIVSTNVGDVREIIDGTDGCYIASYDPQDIANKLKLAISFGKTEGRSKIIYLSTNKIANIIISLYKDILQS